MRTFIAFVVGSLALGSAACGESSSKLGSSSGAGAAGGTAGAGAGGSSSSAGSDGGVGTPDGMASAGSGGSSSSAGSDGGAGTTDGIGDAGSGDSSSNAGSGGGHPSCDGLPETCGAMSASKCCDPLQVPGGTFDRSYDGVRATDDTNPATVSAFGLDRFEVTVGRFRRFVETGGGTRESPPPLQSGAVAGASATGWTSAWTEQLPVNKAALAAAIQCRTGFSTWTNNVLDHETRPMNCVTWYEAQAFCIWDGGRLATEAEWNFVAAAGSQQRVYPWSSPATVDTISTSQASYYLDDSKQCYGDGVVGCTTDDLVVVGSKTGQSLWGHFDLSGNVREWVYDYYADTYPNPCVDCVQAAPSAQRVMRGGGFVTGASGLTASARDENDPLTRAGDVGFRCAYGR